MGPTTCLKPLRLVNLLLALIHHPSQTLLIPGKSLASQRLSYINAVCVYGLKQLVGKPLLFFNKTESFFTFGSNQK